jgi:hypothetical protein
VGIGICGTGGVYSNGCCNQAWVLKKSLNKMPFNLGACPRRFSGLGFD